MDLGTILDQEQGEFAQVGDRWRPTDLLLLPQIHTTLQDMQARYDGLMSCQQELFARKRGPIYAQCLRTQRLHLRVALQQWRSDQLAFLRAVAGYYVESAKIYRMLRWDRRLPTTPSAPSGPATLPNAPTAPTPNTAVPTPHLPPPPKSV